MDTNIYGKYKCPCCDYYTLDSKADNTFQLCLVCFWEDDGIQLGEPDYEGGANEVSLNQARANFRKYKVSEERLKEYVRPPADNE